ncbi:hypothetical protein C5167_009471 [Papaver somniferum]|uniref:BSD2 cysteine rich domain-containing protein n=1 Tax=Papaver somniferum TaxID=3469 RepID=A0A4Y7JXH3_PAPSO|nr:hypothetical protein C5167_009471 [Papaver somniferum]
MVEVRVWLMAGNLIEVNGDAATVGLRAPYSHPNCCIWYCFSFSFTTHCSGILISNPNAPKVIRLNSDILRSSQTPKPHSVVVKADANPSPVVQVSTVVCVVSCSQCEGNGVNSVDHLDRRFKAGGLGWLCSSRRIGDVCVRKGAN